MWLFRNKKLQSYLMLLIFIYGIVSVIKHVNILKRMKKTFRMRTSYITKNLMDHSNLLGKACNKVEAKRFNFTAPSLQQIESQYKDILPGGHWVSNSSSSRTAIVIPFKDRKEHLLLWLKYMMPYLKEQNIDFTIFIIEQENYEILFNKGILFNAGFKEINKLGKFDCFILHDIDLIAENVCNLYMCEEDTPVHLAPAVDTLKYDLLYKYLIGGVLAIEPHVYEDINGFTNVYYGWGGEDDELSYRIKDRGYSVSRSNSLIGRYTMLHHNRPNVTMERSQQSTRYHSWRYSKCDGLNSVKYELGRIEKLPLYTKISIQFSGPKTVAEGKVQFKKEKKQLHWKCS